MRKQGSGKLESLIREEAKKNLNSFNNLEMLKFHQHNQICKKLVELSDNHNYPMTQLVYIAIGKNAHRPIVFEKGYVKIDEEKVELFMKLCEVFAKKFGSNWRTNAFLCHTIDRYLEITKHRKELKFRQLVNTCDIDFNTIKYKTAKQLAKDFFGREAEYSNGGYIVSINECM